MKRLACGVVILLLATVSQVAATDFYADASRPDDSGDGLSWGTAKKTIQAAVDLTIADDVVHVNDGLYDSGGIPAPGGSLTNRVYINKSIELRSENGPEFTFIVGAQASGGGLGPEAVRGLFIDAQATKVTGITISNGYTSATANSDGIGGAIYAPNHIFVSNCTFSGNAAYRGGALHGTSTIYASRFLNNSAIGGGGATYGDIHAYDCRFTGNLTTEYGGAMDSGSANNCTFINNHANIGGGAIMNAQATGCTFIENSTGGYGGALYGIWADNCTFTSNSANFGGAGYKLSADHCTFTGNWANYGGGMSGGRADFCTFTDNRAYQSGGGMSSSIAGTNGEGFANDSRFINNWAANSGGGIFQGTASNCTIYANTASTGGGVRTTVVYNSRLIHNTASDGGGTYGATLNNCTLTGNTATRYGGGSYQGTANNCIIWYNSAATSGQDMYSPSASYSCSPDLTHGNSNCITNRPLLISNSHLSMSSPCIGGGNAAYASGKDIDYENWASPPAMGCDQPDGVPDTYIEVEISGLPSYILTGREAVVRVMVIGEVSSFDLDFGNGNVVSNELGLITNVWTSAGVYPVKLTTYRNPGQEADTITRNVNVASMAGSAIHVSPVGNDTNSGLSWAEAKATVQAAIDDHPYPGGLVLLTNGTYQLQQEILIDREVTIDSVSGPEFTILDGRGSNRCFRVEDDIPCLIGGLTISNGYSTYRGAGIYCQDELAVVSNCVITANTLVYRSGYGGGMYQGTAINCIFSYNSALKEDGDSYGGYGGGMANGKAENCLFIHNISDNNGGGCYNCTLINCTLTENWAQYGGGGVYDSYYITNCIAWNNTASDDPNLYVDDPNHTCSPDAPHGTDGCITNAPLFLDAAAGDYRLHPNSPCIDAGNNTAVTKPNDLDGAPRINYGTVDMGCYEWVAQPYWLAKSTDEIAKPVAVGQPAPDALLQVWNVGTSNMSYSLSTDEVWLNLSPASGSSSGERDDITVSFNTTGLPVGSYTGLITIAAADAANTPQLIDVIATVYEPTLDHFEWSNFGGTKTAGTPINLSITATDGNGYTVPSFTNSIKLTGWIPAAAPNELTIGTGTDTSYYPMCTRNHDARQQTIYLQSWLGEARRITALALNVETPPGQTMENWTIRMRHTDLDDYSANTAWATDWTTVLQTNATVISTGWITFPFDTPFEYNGTDNLMIDLSHNNSSYTSYGYCYTTETTIPRSLEYRSNSDYGDPLDWAGTSDPDPKRGYYPPNIRLSTLVAAPVSITPTNTGSFSAGIWTGNVTVLPAATNLFLLADDAGGHTGQSHLFNVLLDSDTDGIPDYWETLHYGGPSNAVATALAANGLNTVYECYVADLNPADTEAFVIKAFNNSDVWFDSSSNRLYSLLWRTNLTAGAWMSVAGPRAGTGETDSMSRTNDAPQGYFRVEVQLP